MIRIAGTDFDQPTDKSIVAYSGSKYILISSGDTIQRVLMSAFAEANGIPEHNHDGEVIRPLSVALADGEDSVVLQSDWQTSVRCYDQETNYGGILLKTMNGAIDLQPHLRVDLRADEMDPAFAITGATGTRHAVADGWNLHACSLSEKEDVLPIAAPLDKLDEATGITYTQDGDFNSGIPAEDLDAIGLPHLTQKDENDKYTTVNPAGLIPLIWEALKGLKGLLEDFDERLNTLENK